MLINLDYANAARLLLPASENVQLVLAGCGGTGSWLAPSVARVARLLVERDRKNVDIYFVDPDTVEPKNVYRQNFCEAEVGLSKAEALAWRYGLAWGVSITALPRRIEEHGHLDTPTGLSVFIGCVDNGAGRAAIQRKVKLKAGGWWLDCGNSKSGGQVLLGSGGTQPENPFELPGFCSWLPMPTYFHPELLEPDAPAESGGPACLSCAEMALQDSQGLAINQRMAAEAADYLVRMLVTRDLRKRATYIDLESGVSRSEYIAEGVE